MLGTAPVPRGSAAPPLTQGRLRNVPPECTPQHPGDRCRITRLDFPTVVAEKFLKESRGNFFQKVSSGKGRFF